MVMTTERGTRPPTIGRRFSAVGLSFVLVVLAEVFAFIGVAHLIGLGWAFLLLLAVSATGMYLLRHEGPRAWRQLREYSQTNGQAGTALSKHVTGVLASILIALPGFLTAIAGAALFLPPVRKLAGKGATAFATKRVSSATAGDLFGPRRVKVKVGKPVNVGGSAASDDSTPIEGEIV